MSFLESYNKCFTGESFFHAGQILFNLTCMFAVHHGKSFVPSFFESSLLITYLITVSPEKEIIALEKVLYLDPRICTNPVYLTQANNLAYLH